jgi:hypothetical protein
MNWNDDYHGHPLVPQAGMVVQDTRTGEWHIVRDVRHKAYSNGAWLQIGMNPGNAPNAALFTPILPAPSKDYTPWDALEAAGYEVLRPESGCGYTCGDVPHCVLDGHDCYTFIQSDEQPKLVAPRFSLDPDDLPLLETALQHHRVLLAWLAQWPGGER